MGRIIKFITLIVFIHLPLGNAQAVEGFSTNYYTGLLSTFVRSDLSSEVNFNFGTGSPTGVPVDEFSARFSGTIEIPAGEGGSYSFRTYSDDGVRLWVNGQQIINNWTNHPPSYDTASINLNPGPVFIRLEYYESYNSARIELAFRRGSSGTYEIISNAEALSPDINHDNRVDSTDLVAVIVGWGGNGPADVNNSGIVDTDDLIFVMSSYGQNQRPTLPPSAPEVTVLQGATSVIDGSSNISFGSVPVNSGAVDVIFTVRNDGNAVLNLSNLSVTGSSAFSIPNGLVASLAPGASDNFTVRMSAQAAGNFNGQISFSNNDANENPFNFSIAGTVSTNQPSGCVPGPQTTHWGQINLPPGTHERTNLRIDNNENGQPITEWGKGIGAEYSEETNITLCNVDIDSYHYGIWCTDCGSVTIRNSRIIATLGFDSYSIRGNINNFVSSDSVFEADIKSHRFYGLTSGSSDNDIWRGGTMMLGGGSEHELNGQLPFENFTFSNGDIDVGEIDFYNLTHHVTFNNMDFHDTDHLYFHLGAHHITFNGSTNLPPFQFANSNGIGWHTPTPAELAARFIIVNP